MSDTRHKDIDWNLNNPQGSIDTWQHVEIAVLMDIRDELKQINRVFSCSSFQLIPQVLRRISANTHKPKRKKATK